jgi:hypothetical protein
MFPKAKDTAIYEAYVTCAVILLKDFLLYDVTDNAH